MRVKFPRAALVANIVIVGTTLPVALLPVSTSNSPAALPLYQFIDSGSGPLPWNAVSFESSINGTKMLGNPHSASEDGENVLTYRMANAQIGLYVQNASGTTSWTNVSTLVATPTPGSDPVPFFNPAGELNILYVSTTNHLILISATTTRDAQSSHLAGTAIARPFLETDVTGESGLSVASGLASVAINAQSGIIAVRSTTNAAEVLPLSSMTGTSSIQSDPVALHEEVSAFAAVTSAGDVDVFSNVGSSTSAWSVENLTTSSGASLAAGALATTSTSLNTYLGALATNGDVELFSAPLSAGVASSIWALDNVTASTSGSPPLDGDLYLGASGTYSLRDRPPTGATSLYFPARSAPSRGPQPTSQRLRGVPRAVSGLV